MRFWTFALAAATVSSQVMAATPAEERRVSACRLAGKLLPGCDAEKEVSRRGPVVLSFDVEQEDQRGTLATASVKTNGSVAMAKVEQRRHKAEEKESDWCKALSK